MSATFPDVEGEYKKNKRLKRDDVKILEEWMKKQPHLPDASELKLMFFLRSANYKIERAKMVVENYYTIRAHAPEMFANRDPRSDHIQRAINVLLVTQLPGLTFKGYDIMYTRWMDTDSNSVEPYSLFKYFDMSITLLHMQRGPTDGNIMILDSEGTTLGHALKLNLSLAKKITVYFQEGYPGRLKELHILNTSSVAEKIFFMLKPFLHERVLNTIHFHSTLDSLLEFLPQKSMPEEYGGEAGKFRDLHDEMRKKLEDNKTFFKDEEKQIADESKRLNAPKSTGEIFGMEGTFKKLEID